MNAKQYKQQRDAAETALRNLVKSYYSTADKRTAEISTAWKAARVIDGEIVERKAREESRKARPTFTLEAILPQPTTVVIATEVE